MKSKGPVDFFLGVFLEFGAAFCLLFFLPQVTWHWVPKADTSSKTSVPSPSSLSDFATTQRRISLFPPQSELVPPASSLLIQNRGEAPALLPVEKESVIAPATSVPLASHQPAAAPSSHYRRDFPRPYRY